MITSLAGLKTVTCIKISPKMVNSRDIASECRRRRRSYRTFNFKHFSTVEKKVCGCFQGGFVYPPGVQGNMGADKNILYNPVNLMAEFYVYILQLHIHVYVHA